MAVATMPDLVVPDKATPAHFVSYTAPDDGGQLGKKGSSRMMYWRKADNDPNTGEPYPDGGWILLSSDDEQATLFYLECGWRPLRQYGRYLMTRDWNVTLDPYRHILQKGGAKEFPVSQVVAHGWHRKAPYGAEFPQMVGYVSTDVQCKRAGCFRWFNNELDYEKHNSIAHQKASSDENMARAFITASAGMQQPMADLFARMIERMDRQDQVLTALVSKLEGK